jgi:tRNA A37 threonylcarbamoyladenosine dehydratase
VHQLIIRHTLTKITIDNANTIIQSLQPQPTAIIDAIDGMYEKTALILSCVDNRIPIITCGGAAGRMDPTQVVIDDLTKVQEDRLLFKCRKLMRQEHGFPKVPIPSKGKKERVRNWRIFAVYSMEVQQRLAVKKGQDEMVTSSFRTCDGALGTACFVTGTYGFVAASKVVEMIAMDQLVVPKKPMRQ